MIRKIWCFGSAASLCAALLTSAHAQQVPAPGAVAGIPVGVSVVLAPPAGFDPLTASPVAREQYAVPPEPDAVAAPAAHAMWVKAMSGFTNREAPTLTQTTIFNGPNQKVGGSAPYVDSTGAVSNNVVTGTSSNWSGTSVVNSSDPFKVEAIVGEFTVPIARQAFGSCTGGWDYSSAWPGIDGNGSGDVLQAGIEADAYCSGSTTSSYYSAWTEWYPNGEVRVSSPAVSPGDLLFVEVWNTSSTKGDAYFYNLSTEKTATYALTAPSKTTLMGDSVEWIVERPGVNGGLATLTNYVDVAWPYGFAWNWTAKSQTYYYQGRNPAAGTLEVLTMLNNSSKAISYPTLENADFVWDLNEGSSCGRTTGYPSAPPC